MECPLRKRGRVWRRLSSLLRRLLWIASRVMLGACAALRSGPTPAPAPASTPHRRTRRRRRGAPARVTPRAAVARREPRRAAARSSPRPPGAGPVRAAPPRFGNRLRRLTDGGVRGPAGNEPPDGGARHRGRRSRSRPGSGAPSPPRGPPPPTRPLTGEATAPRSRRARRASPRRCQRLGPFACRASASVRPGRP
ncbi:MAG: hypothetical protein MZU84_00885 [Sphingobacterium sp.]|nr:hypothetical protein [Sphingobacterium sp.]